MKLNGNEVDDRLIDRFLKLSNLPGDDHPSIKQKIFVSKSTAHNIIPKWMYSSGIDYFRKDSLISENANLFSGSGSNVWFSNVRMENESSEVHVAELVLIAYNILDDFFVALHFKGERPRVIAMDARNEGVFWIEIYEDFEDFLVDLGL